MAISTLPDYAQDELANRGAARIAAAAAFKTASDKAAKAATNITDLGAKVSAGTTDVAAKRRSLGEAGSAAERAALLEELADLEIALRSNAAKLTAAQKDQRVADAAVTRWTAALAQATQSVAEITAARPAIDAAYGLRSGLLAQATALAALNPGIKAQVNDVETGPDYQAAKHRVENDVPQQLRDDGRARVTTIVGDITTANAAEQTAVDDSGKQPKTHLGDPGAVDTARADLDAKDGALRRILTSPAVLADIVTQLKAIATAPPIPVENTARMTEQAGKKTQATTDVQHAQQADTAASHALDINEQETAALQATFDGGDATVQGALTAHKNAHDGLQGAADAAHAVYLDAVAAAAHTTDKWEDAVPEDAWRRLLAFDELTRQLDTDLAPLDAAAINDARTKLSQAETTLAVAMSTRDKGQRDSASAVLLAEQRRRAAGAMRENRSSALIAALRGDS